MIDALLSNFLWWRKLRGGHWEHWLLDIGGSGEAWIRLKKCSIGSSRPWLACRGTPTCETHGEALDLS